MFCSRCGTQVQDASKFCPSCGLDLISTTPMAAIRQATAASPAQPAEPSEMDIVKEALKEEYELVSELGRGGMAIVFKAREKLLDREVAVKVLPFSLAFDAEFVERFQREARTSAKLEHPHIIPIYRVGKSGRVIYFVMKFLRGKSLSDVIEKGALPPADTRKLLSEAASALGYAHKNGIVHRDIKPDNIMLDELGRAIVTDFGIAKAVTGAKLTGTGMAIGTPHYMSPEQARAQPLDGRSDIYSLGVVGYQCLTGVVPFDGEDSFSIGYKHIMEEVPTPELKTAEQRDLFQIIKRMMAKTPEERFTDADELVKVLGGSPMSAPKPAAVVNSSAATTIYKTPQPPAGAKHPAPSPTPTTPTTPIPRAEPRPQPKAKKKGGGGVLVGLLLLLGGGGGGYYWFVMKPQQDAAAQKAAAPPPVAVADSTAHRADSTAVTPAPTVPAAPTATTGSAAFPGLPRGARVALDGTVQRLEGDSVTGLEPRSYQVVIKAAGYDDFKTTVAIKRGDRVTVAAEMHRTGTSNAAAKAPARSVAQNKAPQTKAEPAPPPASGGAVSCTELGESYNSDGSCFDKRPVAMTATTLAIPENVQGTPTAPILWVWVLSDGSVGNVSRKQDSSDPLFTLAAINFVKGVHFNPAQKDSKSVPAWTQVQVKPQSR